MVECSLCSLLNFLFNCVYHVISCALDYPLVVMALSFLIALIFVTNIYTAKLICDFRCLGRGASTGRGGCTGTGGGEGNSSMNFDYGPDNGDLSFFWQWQNINFHTCLQFAWPNHTPERSTQLALLGCESVTHKYNRWERAKISHTWVTLLESLRRFTQWHNAGE